MLANNPRNLQNTPRETFRTQFISQWSIIMIKMLSFRFQQCVGSFTMLLIEGSSEMGLFRHLSNQVLPSPYFRIYISYEGHLFFKIYKILNRFQKCSKKFTKSFWIACFKLSVLRGKYLSSAVNVWRNSPKILHITKRDFFQMNFLDSDQ